MNGRFSTGMVVAALWLVCAVRACGQAQAQGAEEDSLGLDFDCARRSGFPGLPRTRRFTRRMDWTSRLVLLRRVGPDFAGDDRREYFCRAGDVRQVMMANLGGADLVTVAHTVAGVQSKMLVKPEISNARGYQRVKRIASSGLGSLGDFLYRVVMRKNGLNPDTRCHWLTDRHAAGERLQALASGAVDAADLSYPDDAQGEKMGYRVLWDARMEVSIRPCRW